MSDKPLPCPFCGGEAEQKPTRMVSCRSCGAEAFGPKWNARFRPVSGEPVAWQAREKGSFWRHCDIVTDDPNIEFRPLYAAPPAAAGREDVRALLGALYKTARVMKSARNSKSHDMNIWADDMKAVEDVVLFLEGLRDADSTVTPQDGRADSAQEKIADYWADWLIDAVGCATQNRALLRGDPAEDAVLTQAVVLNGKKAILNALKALGRAS